MANLWWCGTLFYCWGGFEPRLAQSSAPLPSPPLVPPAAPPKKTTKIKFALVHDRQRFEVWSWLAAKGRVCASLCLQPSVITVHMAEYNGMEPMAVSRSMCDWLLCCHPSGVWSFSLRRQNPVACGKFGVWWGTDLCTYLHSFHRLRSSLKCSEMDKSIGMIALWGKS